MYNRHTIGETPKSTDISHPADGEISGVVEGKELEKTAGGRTKVREMANGKGTIIAIITVGIGLGTLILNSQRMLTAAIESNRDDIGEIRSDIADLRERTAQLEARMDTLVEVFADRED